MKYILVILSALILTVSLKAQVMLTPNASASANNLPELLSVTLFNGGNNSVNGHLDFKVYENSRLIISGNSKSIELNSQATLNINLISAEQKLAPLQFSYVDGAYRTGINNGYLMPEGIYRLCLRYIENGNPLSDEVCQTKNTGISTAFGGQLHLINPPNESETPTTNPIFSWVNMGRGITYEIKIVEVVNQAVGRGGNTGGLIASNPIIHREDNLNSFTFIYPISAPTFEQCKTYAWQVTAYEKGIRIDEITFKKTKRIKGVSEVYTFTTSCNPTSNARMVPSSSYFTLSKEPNHNVYQLSGGVIPFKYVEKYNSDQLKIKVLDYKGQTLFPESVDSTDYYEVVLDSFSIDANQQLGTYYLEIDVSEIIDTSVITYFLEVMNAKGEVWKAKFKF